MKYSKYGSTDAADSFAASGAGYRKDHSPDVVKAFVRNLRECCSGQEPPVKGKEQKNVLILES